MTNTDLSGKNLVRHHILKDLTALAGSDDQDL
jgi:hypothetical protein